MREGKGPKARAGTDRVVQVSRKVPAQIFHMQIAQNNYTGYVVTGLLYRSQRRFSHHTANAVYAFGINLWRGSVWGVRKDTGRRQLLKRVTN